jgi:hypothetical protein
MSCKPEAALHAARRKIGNTRKSRVYGSEWWCVMVVAHLHVSAVGTSIEWKDTVLSYVKDGTKSLQLLSSTRDEEKSTQISYTLPMLGIWQTFPITPRTNWSNSLCLVCTRLPPKPHTSANANILFTANLMFSGPCSGCTSRTHLSECAYAHRCVNNACHIALNAASH